MSKVLMIATSNSSISINKQVCDQISGVDVLSLREFDVPMYSYDYEQKFGIPQSISRLSHELANYPKIIFAVPEYNGNLSGFFKNILDWLTRIDLKFLQNKQVGIITVTPGGRGGANVRKILSESLPFFGAQLAFSHGISKFTTIDQIDEQIKELQATIEQFKKEAHV